jgi:hypothetical protein
MELKFPEIRTRRRIDWRKWALGALLGMAVASAGLYLYRDVRHTFRSDTRAPKFREGSLRVNVNVATVEELESIPGIGPALAAQIIAGRPYSSVEQLERVRGVSRSSVDSIRLYVKVEGVTEVITR